MSAEDYDDVPGFGSGSSGHKYASTPKSFTCRFCGSAISFNNRKPFNVDGSPHRCMRREDSAPPSVSQEATLYAMAAMNAIISGQIQSGGVDHIHRMNFHDVADAAWQVAVAMVKAEENHRHELAKPY